MFINRLQQIPVFQFLHLLFSMLLPPTLLLKMLFKLKKKKSPTGDTESLLGEIPFRAVEKGLKMS